VLPVLADAAVPRRHVTALLPVLLKARRHHRRSPPPGVGLEREEWWEETLEERRCYLSYKGSEWHGRRRMGTWGV
jgi:hypothetical protein